MYCHSLWRRRRREEGRGGEEERVGREERGGGEEGKGRGGGSQTIWSGGGSPIKGSEQMSSQEGLFPAHTTTTEMHTTNTLIHRKPFLVSECKQVQGPTIMH